MANNKLDLRSRIERWMIGRNGPDELGMACTWLALILYIVAAVSGLRLIYWVAIVLLIYSALRMGSRSVAARRNENQAFLAKAGPLGGWLRNPSAAMAEAHEYKHLKCPQCGRRMRVPRKKGKLRVTCPSCGHRFEAKS